MVRSAERVSNHEAPIVASSFETRPRAAPQDEGIDHSVTARSLSTCENKSRGDESISGMVLVYMSSTYVLLFPFFVELDALSCRRRPAFLAAAVRLATERPPAIRPRDLRRRWARHR